MNKTIAGLVCAIVMLVAIITAVVVSRPNESEEQLQIETNIADEWITINPKFNNSSEEIEGSASLILSFSSMLILVSHEVVFIL